MLHPGGVLVADDSLLCMQLMATLLEPYATKVITACGAREAIACCDEHEDLDPVVEWDRADS